MYTDELFFDDDAINNDIKSNVLQNTWHHLYVFSTKFYVDFSDLCEHDPTRGSHYTLYTSLIQLLSEAPTSLELLGLLITHVLRCDSSRKACGSSQQLTAERRA